MLFFPFLYFTILTIYWWIKHQSLDVCVYMSGLYAFTSFIAIILVLGDMLDGGGILFDNSDIKLDFLPTITYCILITLSILPFYMINGRDLKRITPSIPYVLETLCVILFINAVLNFYLVAGSTLEILSGNLETVRLEHYGGLESPAEIKAESMPLVVRLFRYLNRSTLLALPIFFYSICFEKKPWWWNTMLFFTSLCIPILSIQTVDRTEFIFYAQMFVFCMIFFHNHFSKKVKRLMVIMVSTLASLFIVYMVAVSVARFDEREGGAGTSAMQYAGQGYLNFCYFWENGKFDYIATEREFPLINHAIFDIDSNADRRGDRSGKQGFYISVFPTFAGDILLDLSPIGVLIWIMYYTLAAFMVIKASRRKEFDIGETVAIFTLAVIPVFGIFYYRYFHFTYTLMIMLSAILYILSKFKSASK